MRVLQIGPGEVLANGQAGEARRVDCFVLERAPHSLPRSLPRNGADNYQFSKRIVAQHSAPGALAGVIECAGAQIGTFHRAVERLAPGGRPSPHAQRVHVVVLLNLKDISCCVL